MAGLILHLVRHPEPEITTGVCYGQLDVPARQVDVCAQALQGRLPPGLPVWSSPLQRCRALAEALGRPFVLDARLMEMNFGHWEGRPWQAVSRRELDAWAADLDGFSPPEGESATEVRQRVVQFVAQLTVPEAILITHAGVIRLLRAHYQHKSLAEMLELKIPFGGVCRLVVD